MVWLNPKERKYLAFDFPTAPPGFLGCNINPQHNHHRAVWASVAVFALATMQALLDLGTEARMNYPSRLGGNWEWLIILLGIICAIRAIRRSDCQSDLLWLRLEADL
ncbi:MAG: 4-alpha-glucanotransferase [Chloroflexi bacterium]|nr:4-alpha-glucanotransferase [Chloroflexota bacterium]